MNNSSISVFKSFFNYKNLVHPKKSGKKSKKSEKKLKKFNEPQDFFCTFFKDRTPYLGVNNPSLMSLRHFLVKLIRFDEVRRRVKCRDSQLSRRMHRFLLWDLLVVESLSLTLCGTHHSVADVPMTRTPVLWSTGGPFCVRFLNSLLICDGVRSLDNRKPQTEEEEAAQSAAPAAGMRQTTFSADAGRYFLVAPSGPMTTRRRQEVAFGCDLVPASKLMRVAHLKSRQSRHLWSAQWNRTALSCIRWRPLGTSDVLHWGMENPISSATHISARKVLHRHRSARVIPLRMNFCGFFFSLFFRSLAAMALFSTQTIKIIIVGDWHFCPGDFFASLTAHSYPSLPLSLRLSDWLRWLNSLLSWIKEGNLPPTLRFNPPMNGVSGPSRNIGRLNFNLLLWLTDDDP